MVWFVVLGVIGGIWLITVGLPALVDADIGMKQKKSITPIRRGREGGGPLAIFAVHVARERAASRRRLRR